MNLHNETEFEELLRQRILCGWDKTPSHLETWREQADKHTLSLFWIVPTTSQTHVGHIAMTLKTSDAGTRVQHICNLFVLLAHRGNRLASSAVRALESEALALNCAAITLNALSRRYVEDDEERVWYAKLCQSLGIEMPKKGSSNEDWYARMGYVKWNEERLYPVTVEGEGVLLWAAWMRKELV